MNSAASPRAGVGQALRVEWRLSVVRCIGIVRIDDALYATIGKLHAGVGFAEAVRSQATIGTHIATASAGLALEFTLAGFRFISSKKGTFCHNR